MWRAADLVRHYRFSSPLQLSTPAWRQQSRLCRNGSVAQLFGRPGSLCRLSGKMPPRNIRGHSPSWPCVAKFRASSWSFRMAFDSAGKITTATLLTRFAMIGSLFACQADTPGQISMATLPK